METRTLTDSNMTTPASVSSGQPSREDAQERATGRGRSFLFVAILVTVNLGAVSGQAGWFYGHATFTSWFTVARLALALVLALAVELSGVYLSAEADEARRQDQPYLMLLLGSVLVGGFAAWLNWSHFSSVPDAGHELARVFAGLSLASPILWTVYSIRRNHERLVALGLAGKRGVKLSGARKFFHPLKSLRVMSWAAWAGVRDEVDAVKGWEIMRKPAEAEDSAPVSPATETKAGWWAKACAVWAEEPSMSRIEVAERIGCSDRWLRMCDPAKTK